MFLENKYSKWYYNIIINAMAQNRSKKDSYFENHHILPKSLGGTNTSSNLVLLTAREHFICHMLLIKMCKDTNQKIKMCRALMYLKGGNKTQTRYINARIYEHVRVVYNFLRHSTYNRELDIERRQKIAETMKKRWQDEEYRKNHAFLKISKAERSLRGKKGNAAYQKIRKANPKIKKPPTYKDIHILKNGHTKIIKNNQFPAYQKYGWVRL